MGVLLHKILYVGNFILMSC